MEKKNKNYVALEKLGVKIQVTTLSEGWAYLYALDYRENRIEGARVKFRANNQRAEVIQNNAPYTRRGSHLSCAMKEMHELLLENNLLLIAKLNVNLPEKPNKKAAQLLDDCSKPAQPTKKTVSGRLRL
jgi:hypothetical protein